MQYVTHLSCPRCDFYFFYNFVCCPKLLGLWSRPLFLGKSNVIVPLESGTSPKCNSMFLGPLATFPENLIKIGSLLIHWSMIWLSFEVLMETAGFFYQQTVADISPLNLKCWDNWPKIPNFRKRQAHTFLQSLFFSFYWYQQWNREG